VSLENSVWRQYHESALIHDVLQNLYGSESRNISTDEEWLYSELKRRLTKKELRLFIMNEAGRDEREQCEALHVEVESLEKLRKRAYHKVQQLRKNVTSEL
jgi:hypothetical protein